MATRVTEGGYWDRSAIASQFTVSDRQKRALLQLGIDLEVSNNSLHLLMPLSDGVTQVAQCATFEELASSDATMPSLVSRLVRIWFRRETGEGTP